ncbi:MAG: hypothetical protein ACK55Z_24185, partial [bacterium]
SVRCVSVASGRLDPGPRASFSANARRARWSVLPWGVAAKRRLDNSVCSVRMLAVRRPGSNTRS